MQRVDRGDSIRVPLIWIALLVSVLFHVGLIVVRWRPVDEPLPPTPEKQGKGALKGRLQTQVAPSRPAVRESPPTAQAPSVEQAPPVAQAPRPAPRPGATRPPPSQARPAMPEVLARPAPGPARVPEVPAPPPAPASPPAESDFSAMVRNNQQRREGPRSALPMPPSPADAQAEDENARRERAVAANLGSLQPRMVGENSREGGGIFRITRMGMEDAEFLFYGWNKAMGRKNTQVVEVRRGSNADIRIAMVRRMIAIIREHEQGDFVWESLRLGRNVNLSARPRDNAELEAFLLADFFR